MFMADTLQKILLLFHIQSYISMIWNVTHMAYEITMAWNFRTVNQGAT